MARLALSLEVLRDQINRTAPHRNKASDGWIASPTHPRPSRHLANGAGVVTALDVTDDPAHGCPIHAIAEGIRTRPHPNLAYIISNRRIAGRSTGWNWHRYTGANPHDRHVHFGVGVGADSAPGQPYDDPTPWHVNGSVSPGSQGPPPPTLRRGSRGNHVRGLQKVLIGARLLPPGADDGVFGPKTEAAVRQLQAQLHVAVDGVVGPRTHAAIARLLAWLAATGG
jgi:hypothetical protein